MNKSKGDPAKPLPTLARLNELFHLDHGTGELTWKVRPSRSRIKVGARAGTLNKATGYRVLGIDGVQYREHRVIYYMATGEDPGSLHIDHIDTDTSNNRPSNLQLVTNQVNKQAQTAQTNNTSGFTGVHFDKRDNKWQARIKADGKNRSLGYFENFEDACKCRIAAELQFFTIQPRREGKQLELYERLITEMALGATESNIERV